MCTVFVDTGEAAESIASGRLTLCSILRLFLYMVYLHKGSYPEDTATSENILELPCKSGQGKRQNVERDLYQVHPRGSHVRFPLSYTCGNIFVWVLRQLCRKKENKNNLVLSFIRPPNRKNNTVGMGLFLNVNLIKLPGYLHFQWLLVCCFIKKKSFFLICLVQGFKFSGYLEYSEMNCAERNELWNAVAACSMVTSVKVISVKETLRYKQVSLNTQSSTLNTQQHGE